MPSFRAWDLEPREIFAGGHARVAHTALMTFVYWQFDAGALVPEHKHPHEQVSNVIDGEFEFVIDGERYLLRAGDVAVIPSNAVHSGKALTPCQIIDVFYPIREDYR